ncbi:MAG: hypothetical protein K2X03_21135 [Bryobacteraceae bacterium]|nr:hypothetical protein [Bryobacteraceae bacterium]
MRKIVAIAMAVVLSSLLVGSPLVACPFLAGKPSCCRRMASQAPKCPLAPSLERCPFYLTEGKLGYVEAKSVPAAPLTVPVPVPAFHGVEFRVRTADGSGVYLLHRVLRI